VIVSYCRGHLSALYQEKFTATSADFGIVDCWEPAYLCLPSKSADPKQSFDSLYKQVVHLRNAIGPSLPCEWIIWNVSGNSACEQPEFEMRARTHRAHCSTFLGSTFRPKLKGCGNNAQNITQHLPFHQHLLFSP
jgi:hypothetical protein